MPPDLHHNTCHRERHGVKYTQEGQSFLTFGACDQSREDIKAELNLWSCQTRGETIHYIDSTGVWHTALMACVRGR